MVGGSKKLKKLSFLTWAGSKEILKLVQKILNVTLLFGQFSDNNQNQQDYFCRGKKTKFDMIFITEFKGLWRQRRNSDLFCDGADVAF